jgi:hypothetical protein
MQRVRRLVTRSWWWPIVREHDTEPAELLGAILSTIWGLWLLSPMHTFRSSAAYNDLALIPEWLLGSTLLVVGINAGLALRSGGVRSRRRSAILMFGSWFAIAAAFAHSDITNTGVVVYGVVTLAAGWVYVRLGVPS